LCHPIDYYSKLQRATRGHMSPMAIISP